uniref:Iron-sulfur cluster assembly enzyme ISCU n=1 Tax=Knipowitschia caucasica TaxID=637954 RepID=A0AAV2J256_KNICA
MMFLQEHKSHVPPALSAPDESWLKKAGTFTVDEALEVVGFGRFHLMPCAMARLCWLCDWSDGCNSPMQLCDWSDGCNSLVELCDWSDGCNSLLQLCDCSVIGQMANSMVVMTLGLVGSQLHCEWRLQSHEEALMISVFCTEILAMALGTSNSFGKLGALISPFKAQANALLQYSAAELLKLRHHVPAPLQPPERGHDIPPGIAFQPRRRYVHRGSRRAAEDLSWSRSVCVLGVRSAGGGRGPAPAPGDFRTDSAGAGDTARYPPSPGLVCRRASLSSGGMALVTLQRSPTPSAASSGSTEDFGSDDDRKNNQCLSESFFMVKGAALFLQQGGIAQEPNTQHTHTGDLPRHLQVMFKILRAEDHIKLTVRLESGWSERVRYLVVIYTSGHQDTEENIVLGLDFADKDSKSCSVGMVLPLWSDTNIHLDGDGGFSVSTAGRSHVFKPVSVQAMWTALQVIHKACEVSRRCNYFPGGGALCWTSFYDSSLSSEQSGVNEWNAMTDLQSTRPDSPGTFADRPTERERTESSIKAKLRNIMMFQDLENITSKEIRNVLEQHMSCNLKDYKEFIDNEMLLILGQMDKATPIFDHVYLGSEWNASNLEELRDCGVGYILNVTREIDNFFPGLFSYHNVRVYDEEATDLLSHWNDTYDFISKAKRLSAPEFISRCCYHDKVVDHYENPRNVGSLDKNSKNVGTGLVGAPACGDVMKLQIQVDNEGKIVDARFKTFGCGSAIASSSLATEWVKGKSVEEALTIKNTDIAKELCLPPVKLHCSMLAEDAIKAALADYRLKQQDDQQEAVRKN